MDVCLVSQGSSKGAFFWDDLDQMFQDQLNHGTSKQTDLSVPLIHHDLSDYNWTVVTLSNHPKVMHTWCFKKLNKLLPSHPSTNPHLYRAFHLAPCKKTGRISGRINADTG